MRMSVRVNAVSASGLKRVHALENARLQYVCVCVYVCVGSVSVSMYIIYKHLCVCVCVRVCVFVV